MASKLELVRRRGSMRERLIVALDVDSLEQAQDLVRLLAGEVGMFKIGKQLFTHAGPQAVRLIQDLGGEIFLDLKFHDIPNTVAKAAIEATRLGVKMFNVHASGSLEMMVTTVKEVERVCRQEKRRRPIMLAVTVLTSLNQDDLKRLGVELNAQIRDRLMQQMKRGQLACLGRRPGGDRGVETRFLLRFAGQHAGEVVYAVHGRQDRRDVIGHGFLAKESGRPIGRLLLMVAVTFCACAPGR